MFREHNGIFDFFFNPLTWGMFWWDSIRIQFHLNVKKVSESEWNLQSAYAFQWILVFLIHTCRTNISANMLQSCPTLCDPMDCSSPSSSVHGTLQARLLEWVAISFSKKPGFSAQLIDVEYLLWSQRTHMDFQSPWLTWQWWSLAIFCVCDRYTQST